VPVCLGRSRSPSSSCWIRLVHPPTLLCSDWMVWQLQDPTRVDVLVRNRNCQFAPRLMARLAVTLSACLHCFHASMTRSLVMARGRVPTTPWKHGMVSTLLAPAPRSAPGERCCRSGPSIDVSVLWKVLMPPEFKAWD
jgi:hypothetical protein